MSDSRPATVQIVDGLTHVATLVLGGGIALVLIAATMTPTMGARRSAALKWQEEKDQHTQEIDKAIQEQSRTEANHE